MNQSNVTQPTKSHTWVWILLVIILIIVISFGYYYLVLKKQGNKETTKIESKKTQEAWQIDPAVIMANKTSTDTHKISDNLYRMFYMDKGGIYYAESTDGKTFAGSIDTGIKEEMGKMISNPSVLKIADSNWIMIYEIQPAKTGGTGPTPPGPDSQRNLYLATSTDGMKFTTAGLAIDSSKEDNYFASVPDLILLPDNKIRLYYVSGGESTGSAISVDNGKTWVRESGFRLKGAVDPNVLWQKKDNQINWVMYYSILDPAQNAIYKATSTDGLSWESVGKVINRQASEGALVDPDVFAINDNLYEMFFGRSASEESTAGQQLDLYRAELNQSIF